MIRRLIAPALSLAALLPLVGGVARADDQAAAARRVQARYQDAVVTVRLVVNLRISFAGREQKKESKTEAVGTVIDPSGLTVLSLSSIDPGKTLGDIVRSKLSQSGQHAEFQIESEVTEANIVRADGTELPAVVVLRDKDLDLAYVRPKEKPAAAMTAVDLAGEPHPAVLESVVCLNRLGKVANHVPAVSIERINALVERPRPFYVLGSGQGTSGVGSPVFTLDGTLVGLVLIRSISVEGEGNLSSMFSGSESLGIMPIIVPARDIREGAKQALSAALKENKAAGAAPATPAPGKAATEAKP